MAEISTDKNSLSKSPTELEKVKFVFIGSHPRQGWHSPFNILGSIQKSFIRGDSAPRSNRLPFSTVIKCIWLFFWAFLPTQMTDFLPFHLIQQVNPLPFHKPEAWKGSSSGQSLPYTTYRPLKRVPQLRALNARCTCYMKSVNNGLLYHVWNSTALHQWEHLQLYLQWAKLLINWVPMSSEIWKCTVMVKKRSLCLKSQLSIINKSLYSQTLLIRTPKGQNQVSAL